MKGTAHTLRRLGPGSLFSAIILMLQTRNIYGYNSFFYRVWRFIVA